MVFFFGEYVLTILMLWDLSGVLLPLSSSYTEQGKINGYAGKIWTRRWKSTGRVVVALGVDGQQKLFKKRPFFFWQLETERTRLERENERAIAAVRQVVYFGLGASIFPTLNLAFRAP